MSKVFSSNIFHVTEHLSIVCHAESTRYGFRHIAVVRENGFELGRAKECYYNRTWESFEFESVIRDAARKIGGEAGEIITAWADKYKEPNQFGAVSALLGLAELLTDDPAQQNELKTKVLAGIPGIDLPEDWQDLSEEEKARRLHGVQDSLNEV